MEYRIRFSVMGGGLKTFRSKDGREFRRASLMGVFVDETGGQVCGTADLAFGGVCAEVPKAGETVYLVIDSFSLRNAMAEATFSAIVPMSSKKGVN